MEERKKQKKFRSASTNIKECLSQIEKERSMSYMNQNDVY